MPDINELQDARAALPREDRAPLPIGVLLSGSAPTCRRSSTPSTPARWMRIKAVVAAAPLPLVLETREGGGHPDAHALQGECLRQTQIPGRRGRCHQLLAAGCGAWLWPVTCAWITPRCSPRSQPHDEQSIPRSCRFPGCARTSGCVQGAGHVTRRDPRAHRQRRVRHGADHRPARPRGRGGLGCEDTRAISTPSSTCESGGRADAGRRRVV